MKLNILGSSSMGNSYLLQSSDEILIIELGVNFKNILKEIDFNIKNIIGALVSHEHSDHSKYVNEVIKRGINVYMTKGTQKAINISSHRIINIEAKKQFNIGRFKIIPFEIIHDCVEPVGFLLDHPESGKVCFITDTAYCKYSFPGLNNVIIEANYCEEIMTKRFLEGSLNGLVRARTQKSHMSFTSTLEFLKANDLTAVNQIILIHLSGGNADPVKFLERTIEATGKTVHIAKPGAEYQLTKTPF